MILGPFEKIMFFGPDPLIERVLKKSFLYQERLILAFLFFFP
jgi:hypothetical protein